ncbi:hypothetical protein M9434_004726 [Picochlorum sp. BPE23]|nr:hypothetical protein M9434_004726 [Picochlorum sp. BPE23]
MIDQLKGSSVPSIEDVQQECDGGDDVAWAIRDALAGGDGAAGLLVRVGKLCMEQGAYETARGYFRESLRLSTDSSVMIQSAKCLDACGDVQSGIDGLEAHAVDDDLAPVDPKVLLTLANMYLKIGEHRKGVDWLKYLAERCGDTDPTVWQVWAMHEWKQGRYKVAKDRFERGLKAGDGPHSPLLVSYAKMEAQRRNRTKARALLRDAIKSGQKNPHAWVAWAQLEGRSGQHRKAIRLCKEGLRQFPNNAFILCSMGQIYEASGDSDSAQDAWERALAVSPSNCFALNELGKLAWKNGEIDRAIQLFSVGVESYDAKGALMCGESLAGLYGFQGDDESVRALFETLDRKFVYKSSRFIRAWASFEKKDGRLGRASELFSESARIDPKDERTWLQWALLEKKRKNIKKALSCVRAGVQVSPLNPFLWQLYGTLAWDGESPENGRSVFEAAMKTCPNNQQILLSWALKESEAGDREKSLDVCRLADMKSLKHIPLLQLWHATADSLGYRAEADRVLKVMNTVS